MESLSQARNMGSVTPDQTVLTFCGQPVRLHPQAIPHLPTFTNASHQLQDGEVSEGKGLPGAHGLLLSLNSLFTVLNTAV